MHGAFTFYFIKEVTKMKSFKKKLRRKGFKEIIKREAFTPKSPFATATPKSLKKSVKCTLMALILLTCKTILMTTAYLPPAVKNLTKIASKEYFLHLSIMVFTDGENTNLKITLNLPFLTKLINKSKKDLSSNTCPGCCSILKMCYEA